MAAVTICSHPRHRAPSLGVTNRPPARPHPSVAVRRRRAAITLVILAALGILLGAGSLAGAGQAPPSSSSRVELDTTAVASATHVVQPGDTLWSVARRIQPEGDVRPLVARLRAAHGPGPLLPGEPLRIAV
jgi:Tfp pilus assembly protein FimV